MIATIKYVFDTTLKTIHDDFPILFRGWLYFMIAALPEFLDGIKCLADGTCPEMTRWKMIWTIGSALVPGLTAIRAFYDGSPQRHSDAKEEVKNEIPKI